MPMTASQAKTAAWVIPSLCMFASACVAVVPAVQAFQQQRGEAERNRQLLAIAKDSLANRCLTYNQPVEGKLKRGGILVDQTPQSLTTSCLYLNGEWGFLAVKDGQVTIMQVYSDKEIKATQTQINAIQGNQNGTPQNQEQSSI